jgi:hypothetical protein
MSIHARIVVCLCLLLTALSSLPSCSSSRPERAESTAGSVSLPLQATAASGNVYQLENATFTVLDAASNVVTQVSTAAFAATDTTLRVPLQAGSYSLRLESGWQMVRLVGASTTFIMAALTSTNPIPVTVQSNQNTPAAFAFNVQGEGSVGFGGNLDISISVSEQDGGVPATPTLDVSIVAPGAQMADAFVLSPALFCQGGGPATSCFQTFPGPTQVTLDAYWVAQSGLVFSNWSGAGCTSATNQPLTSPHLTVSVAQAVTCVANFVPASVTQFTLQIDMTIPVTSATGLSVTSTSGINCDAVTNFDCIEVYSPGTEVTLTAAATAASGLFFEGWLGTGCAAILGQPLSNPTITVSMTQSRTCVASFVDTPPAWTPAQLSPRAWFSAEAQYITLAGTNVSSWADRSGNGFAVAPVGAAPAFDSNGWTAGQGALIFNGAQSLTSSTSTLAGAFNGDDASFSVLAVLRTASDTDGVIAAWESNAATTQSYLRARLTDGGPRLRFHAVDDNGVGAQNDENANLSLTAGNVVAWVRNGTSSVLYTDGNTPDTATANIGVVTTNTFRIGAGLTGNDIFFAGRLAELVVVPRAVTAAEFAQWRTYAKGRWSGLP